MNQDKPTKSLAVALLQAEIEAEQDRLKELGADELPEEPAVAGADEDEAMLRALKEMREAGLFAHAPARATAAASSNVVVLEDFRRGLAQFACHVPPRLFAEWTQQAYAAHAKPMHAAAATGDTAPIEPVRLKGRLPDGSIGWKTWSTFEGLHIEVYADAKPELAGQRIRVVTTNGVELTGIKLGKDAEGNEREVPYLELVRTNEAGALTDTITVPTAAFQKERERLGSPTDWAIKLEQVADSDRVIETSSTKANKPISC